MEEMNKRVKLFRVVGNSRTDAMPVLEQQMNDFIKTVPDQFYIDCVNVQVQKNFLPMTNMGEFEEVWYGSIVYDG